MIEENLALKSFWDSFFRRRGWVGRLVSTIVFGLYGAPLLLTYLFFLAFNKFNKKVNGERYSPRVEAITLATFYASLGAWTWLVVKYLRQWS
jgi:hypothetical protein